MNKHYTSDELNRYTVYELKTIAGGLNVNGRHRMDKATLVEAIIQAQPQHHNGHRQQHHNGSTHTGCGCSKSPSNGTSYNAHRRSGDYTNAVPSAYNGSHIHQTVGRVHRDVHTGRPITTQNGHRRSGDYSNLTSMLGLNGRTRDRSPSPPPRNARRY